MRLLLTFFAVSTVLLINPNEKVFAADLEAGKEVFIANCSACHSGGQNVLRSEKTLEKGVLIDNKMNTISAITTQVTNGKDSMPSFGGKLDVDEINDVANYVLAQSESGW